MNRREFSYETSLDRIPPGNNVPVIEIEVHHWLRDVDDDLVAFIGRSSKVVRSFKREDIFHMIPPNAEAFHVLTSANDRVGIFASNWVGHLAQALDNLGAQRVIFFPWLDDAVFFPALQVDPYTLRGIHRTEWARSIFQNPVFSSLTNFVQPSPIMMPWTFTHLVFGRLPWSDTMPTTVFSSPICRTMVLAI